MTFNDMGLISPILKALQDEGYTDQRINPRVNIQTQVIEISRELIAFNSEITEDFVFFLVIWLWIGAQTPGAYHETDKISFDYYITTGRPLRDVIIGMKIILETGTNVELNTERLLKTKEYLKSNNAVI